MKFKFLPCILMILFSSKLFSQACAADPSFVLPGVYPDAITNLPITDDATASYEALVTLITPTTAVVSGFTFTYVSGQVNSVSGLPTGFTYNCNTPTCTFGPGTANCIAISGSPMVAGAGTYPISVSITATVFNPIFGTVTQTETYSDYVIHINHAPVCGMAEGVSVTDVTDGSVTINWDASIADNYKVTIIKTGDSPIRAHKKVYANTVTIEGLSACSNYQFAITAFCSGAAYKTGFYYFSTSGCRLGSFNEDASFYNDNVVSVYPNPVKSLLTADYFSIYENTQLVQIFDITGKLLISKSIQMIEGENTIELDVNNLNTGMYLLSIQDGENSYVTKFVK